MNPLPTSVEEFDRFLSHLPAETQNKLYLIPLVRDGKEPDVAKDESWKDPTYRLTIDVARQRLKMKSNVGIVATKDSVLIIDQDNMDQFTAPKPTLTILSRNGKHHYYYINGGDVENKDLNINKVHICEIRADMRYVVSPGSFVPPDKDSREEAEGLYRVIDPKPINTLSLKDLPKELQPTEKRQVVLNGGGTYRNKWGWSIQELRIRDKKLNLLLSGPDTPGFPSASESDMSTLTKLIFWDYTDEEAVSILKTFRYREKLDRDNYLVTTLSKIKKQATISDAVDVKTWHPNKGNDDAEIEELHRKIEERTKRLSEIKPETLEDLHKMNSRWLELTDADKEFLEIIYAAGIDRELPGDPVWLYAIAPSGGMKTAAARSLNKYHRIYTLDTITPSTLISGLSKVNKQTNEIEPAAGILQYLDGKTLVIKDFTTILSQNEENRNELYGQLRAIYDGYFEKAFGSLPQPIRIKANIGLILCVTPIIDEYTKAHTSLGERLIKIRQHPDMEKTTTRSIQNQGKEVEMNFELQNAVAYYLNSLKTNKLPTITKEQEKQIIELAQLTALSRSHVFAEYSKGQIVGIKMVEAEVPTRLVKQLKKLALLLAIIRKHEAVDAYDMKTVARVSRDSATPKRMRIIEELAKNGARSSGNISGIIKLHPQTTYNELQLMEALGIVDMNKGEFQLTIKIHRFYKTLLNIEEQFNLLKGKGNEVNLLPTQLPPYTLPPELVEKMNICVKCGIKVIDGVRIPDEHDIHHTYCKPCAMPIIQRVGRMKGKRVTFTADGVEDDSVKEVVESEFKERIE